MAYFTTTTEFISQLRSGISGSLPNYPESLNWDFDPDGPIEEQAVIDVTYSGSNFTVSVDLRYKGDAKIEIGRLTFEENGVPKAIYNTGSTGFEKEVDCLECLRNILNSN